MFNERNRQFDRPRDNKFISRRNPQPIFQARSLFSNQDQYQEAERMTLHILNGKIGQLTKDAEGSVDYAEVLEIIDSENIELKFMNYEHLVEIFLRHTPFAFRMVDGDRIQLIRPEGAGQPVEPPEFLYFGTVMGVACKAFGKGLQSRRHPYVILQESKEAATLNAKSFSEETKDTAVVITIKALQASQAGTKFIKGNRDGQVMTEHISRTHLKFEPRDLVQIDTILADSKG